MSVDPGAFAAPRHPKSEECLFYHAFDFPDGTHVPGEWDMRGNFDRYVGDLDLAGKRVIDFGTASGFLSFEAEKRGAAVTSFDADSTARYTPLPHTPSPWTENRPGAITEANKWLDAVKNSYWFAHHKFSSRNHVFYGDVFNIPDTLGKFDVAILGQFLVHNRSGIDVLQAVARTTTRYLVITEGIWDIAEPAGKLIGRADAPNDFFSNWLYSPAFYYEITGMLGFKCNSFTKNKFKCNAANHTSEMELATFVFERRAAS